MGGIADLTEREREVLVIIGRDGLTSKEAAVRAGISHYRVNELCEAAVRKLGVANRKAAVRMILAQVDEEIGAPPISSGAEPIGVFVPGEAARDRAVSGEAHELQPDPPPPLPEPGTPRLHARRSSSAGDGLEGLGADVAEAGLASEQAPGPGPGDGDLDRIGQTPRDAHLPPDPGDDGHHRWASLHGWVTGGTPYADLTPPQRSGALLLLAAAIVVLTSWIVSFSLQINNSIQHAMPPRLHNVHAAWIAVEDDHQHGTLTGGHHDR